MNLSKAVTLLAGLLVCVGLAQPDWIPQASGVTVTLRAVACAGPDSAWAVGDGGTILRTTDGGATWDSLPSGTTGDLYGVDFADSRNGWVAGSGPVILNTTDGGGTWVSQTPGTANDLRGIVLADANRGWAVGISGTIVGTTDGGGTWAPEISGVFGLLAGVAAASPAEAWAIGADPLGGVAPVYHYDGADWTRQHDITRHRNGRAITVTGGQFLWAVADSGTIAHSTDGGAGWAEQNSGTTAWLGGADAVSADRCWVVGEGGMVRRTTDGGATWTLEVSESVSDLHGIRMLDSVHGRAVGADGRILFRTGGVGVEERTGAVPAGRRATLVAGVLRLRPPAGRRVEVRLHDAGGRLARVLYSGPCRPELALPLDGIPAGTYLVGVTGAGRREWLRFVKVN